MLHHAVELLLDTAAEAAVRRVWERLCDEGLSSTMLDLGARPHVTLAVYNGLDPAAFHEPARAFFASQTPVPVSFASVGSFPGTMNVAFLAPVVTRGLLDMHEQFHHGFRAHDGAAWPYYRPGAWVPHATIGIHLEEIAVPYALDIARGTGLPIEGRIESAALVSFEAGSLAPIEAHYEMPLGG